MSSRFCVRHGVGYGALEQCAACVDDPGPPPDEVEADEPVQFPAGIPDPDAVLVELADDLADARSLRATIWHRTYNPTPVDPHAINTYCKLVDSIAKMARILLDAGYQRRDAVLIDRREKRLTRTKTGAGH